MRIGLFGFTFGHENMGCQALTCSFLEILKKILSDGEKIEIVNFHGEKNNGYIPELFPEMHFEHCLVKLKDKNKKFIKELQKCDVIFDETYGDGFSDIYFTKSVYKSTFIKCICAKSKVPFILTPQTYGPFKHKSLEWLAGRAIKMSTYAYARDHISANYAAEISGKHVKTVTDLAFALPYKKEKDTTKKKLGLNVSGLLWQGGFGGNINQFRLTTNYQKYCKNIVEYALNEGYEVHLISHVTKPYDTERVVPDSDYDACKLLSRTNDKVIIAPCFRNPYDVKNYIANMDIFIGARMHATIGAFSSEVITIPFAYSRKFQGLYENLGYPYYIDGTKLSTNDSIERTIKLINNHEILTKSQQRAMKSVSENLEKFENDLKKICSQVKQN
jgi:polysaccharide pyruvyl transferase WcaK-like protein